MLGKLPGEGTRLLYSTFDVADVAANTDVAGTIAANSPIETAIGRQNFMLVLLSMYLSRHA
jgi:hypothetical protein